MKEWLRIDHTDDDIAIADMIAEAVSEIERRTGRQFREATGTLKLSDFPTGRQAIVVPCPPLRSVTSVTYFDLDETEVTLDVEVNTDSLPGQIYPPSGESWPVATNKRSHPVVIEFTCGQPPTDRQKDIVGCLRIMLDLAFHDLTPMESRRLEKRRDAIIYRYRVRDLRLSGITYN